MGPAKYMEVVNACKPDLWASLPDEVPTWVTEKRNRMSVDRTLQWLDHCLSLQPVCHISIQTTFQALPEVEFEQVSDFLLLFFVFPHDVLTRDKLPEYQSYRTRQRAFHPWFISFLSDFLGVND